MELHITPRVKLRRAPVTAGNNVSQVCERYLERLPLSSEQHRTLASRITGPTPRDALIQLHGALAGRHQHAIPAYGSVTRRLQLAFDDREPLVQQGDNILRLDAERRRQMPRQLVPPLQRASMTPYPWGPLNPARRWLASLRRRRDQWIERSTDDPTRQPWPANIPLVPEDVVDVPDARGRWQTLGNIRRIVLLTLMLAQTILATYYMSQVLPYQGTTLLEMLLLGLFAVLFCWVSAGFWTAMAGFLVLMRGNDRYAIARHVDDRTPIPEDARTAIVMPICNEDVTRVMAGLRATYESVARSGELARFDFFVLSDSSDSDIRSAELTAWATLCRAVGGFGHIFYRHRTRRVKRKSGNIDDFCRRWGSAYRYMIVLDADSVMSGTCITKLVRMMEANPGAGIIQTAPTAAGRDTLYARIQQFSTRLYGPLFTAGLHYWQLGESHYWGHNAIIRVAPFMRHCALSPLPGRGSLAGEILSHDFVEAALMRRAGWAVWIAYDLDGSHEEMPPNLLDELKRDRRWCHGNLMNFRLVTARGMHPVHRTVFVTGVMAYLSAPLWCLFLALSTGMLAQHMLTEPQYFVEPRQLFPIWPQWHPEKALALFSATATLLFLPKILSVLLLCLHGAQQFGGRLRLVASMLLETLFSMLLAPVRMLFHTRFVTAAFLGLAIHWKSPPRADTETTWREAISRHGWHTLLGLVWGTGVYLLNPAFLPWLLPIAGALVLSMPVSVLSSRVSPGRLFRRAGLFMVPEEMATPTEWQATFAYNCAEVTPPNFTDAVIDPIVNALVCASGRPRLHLPLASKGERERLALLALQAGPTALSDAQKNLLLSDPILLSRLHIDTWTSAHAHPDWHEATTHREST